MTSLPLRCFSLHFEISFEHRWLPRFKSTGEVLVWFGVARLFYSAWASFYTIAYILITVCIGFRVPCSFPDVCRCCCYFFLKFYGQGVFQIQTGVGNQRCQEGSWESGTSNIEEMVNKGGLGWRELHICNECISVVYDEGTKCRHRKKMNDIWKEWRDPLNGTGVILIYIIYEHTNLCSRARRIF